jgi:hypothetical protein
MYIVISMPNRKSTACGVSHFIEMSFVSKQRQPKVCCHAPYPLLPDAAGKGDHHETRLMIFTSPATLHSKPVGAANIEATDEAADST